MSKMGAVEPPGGAAARGRVDGRSPEPRRGATSRTPTRTLALWCPDWPLVAAGAGRDEPAAVFSANRVVACTPAARAHGVRRHQRRREAQARCPELAVLAHDPSRDARVFEPVAAAMEALTPRIELTRPGQLAFPTLGPSRYWGGDQALAERALTLAAGALDGGPPIRVGVADGPFTAALAARAASPARPVLVVAPGGSAGFLAPLPLTALDAPELTDVLGRLGLRCLGDLAALTASDVLARFGAQGLTAWHLAAGLDEKPPATEPPPPELTVAAELDPPAEQVGPAAFVARGLAGELYRRLTERGSACTRVVVGAETEHGEVIERVWRCGDAGGGRNDGAGWDAGAGAFTAAALADRVRWQLDGWLTGSSRCRPTAGISRLWLAPEEVVAATGRQLGFWGSDAATGDRATRAVARVQGLLGTGAVAVPEWRGGRDPVEQVALVEAEAVDLESERPASRAGWVEAPWPGRIPPPAPAVLPPEPLSAEVTDARGRPVGVSGRGEVSAAPARLRVEGGRWQAITGWAGPWPVEERWWDPGRRRRRARFQLVTAAGAAHLAVLEAGQWHLTATYD
jgi:protein ImuB